MYSPTKFDVVAEFVGAIHKEQSLLVVSNVTCLTLGPHGAVWGDELSPPSTPPLYTDKQTHTRTPAPIITRLYDSMSLLLIGAYLTAGWKNY